MPMFKVVEVINLSGKDDYARWVIVSTTKLYFINLLNRSVNICEFVALAKAKIFY